MQVDGPAAEPEEEHEELDEEAQALLKELEESQAEVQRMLADQRAQASELGGMKDSLSSEVWVRSTPLVLKGRVLHSSPTLANCDKQPL
jgi:hypothetical protein